MNLHINLDDKISVRDRSLSLIGDLLLQPEQPFSFVTPPYHMHGSSSASTPPIKFVFLDIVTFPKEVIFTAYYHSSFVRIPEPPPLREFVPDFNTGPRLQILSMTPLKLFPKRQVCVSKEN